MINDRLFHQVEKIAQTKINNFTIQDLIEEFTADETENSLIIYKSGEIIFYINKEFFIKDIFNMYLFEVLCYYKCIDLIDSEKYLIDDFLEKMTQNRQLSRGH